MFQSHIFLSTENSCWKLVAQYLIPVLKKNTFRHTQLKYLEYVFVVETLFAQSSILSLNVSSDSISFIHTSVQMTQTFG